MYFLKRSTTLENEALSVKLRTVTNGLQPVRNDPYHFHNLHENFQFTWACTNYIMHFINHKISLTSSYLCC